MDETGLQAGKSTIPDGFAERARAVGKVSETWKRARSRVTGNACTNNTTHRATHCHS